MKRDVLSRLFIFVGNHTQIASIMENSDLTLEVDPQILGTSEKAFDNHHDIL